MSPYKLKYHSVIFCLILFLSVQSKAQLAISGLPCTVAGGTSGYLYTISGNIDSADNISWSVTGGVIAGTTNTSLSGVISTIGAQIRIVWNAGATNAQIQLTDDRLGTSALSVTVLTINNTITASQQLVDTGSTVIISSDSLSASCTPLYDFWWEKASVSDGPFTQIDGETGQNLSINSVTEKAYYRRVLSINGDIIYSNTVLIDVQ